MKIRFVIPTMVASLVLIASLSSAGTSKTIKVDCSKGQSISKATGDIFAPNCGSEPPEQIFFDQTFTLP